MAVRTIPQMFEYVCDRCGASRQEKAPARYPSRWSAVRHTKDAYDYAGVAVADASREWLLCQDCTDIVSTILDMAMQPAKAADVDRRSGACGMTEGDRVIHTIDGRRGVAEEFLQDGDAYVTFDGDTVPTAVKWNYLIKESDNGRNEGNGGHGQAGLQAPGQAAG